MTASSRSRFFALGWIAAGVFAMIAGVLGYLRFGQPPHTEQLLRYSIALPENSALHSFALSSDGRHLVIAAAVNGKRQLWLRPLDALQAQPIPGTEDARYPFWSPDNRYIGFFAQGKLKKIAAAGGPSQPLCEVTDGRGGSWSRDDVIVFSPNGSTEGTMQRVSASGGVPSDVTNVRSRHLFPVFLPDGRHFLYEVGGLGDRNGIYVASLDGEKERRILKDASSVVFAPSAPGSRAGHLLFLRENSLMAQPFDARSGQISGEVFTVAEGVRPMTASNYAPIAVSENGVLLVWSGGGGGSGSLQIVWYDRAGKLLESVSSPGVALMPAISPDEKAVAFMRAPVAGAEQTDIWLRDRARRIDRRFTSDDASRPRYPVWSPKGDRIAFAHSSGDFFTKATDDSTPEEKLLSTPNAKVLDQWSRDGRFIVYSENDPKTKGDIWVLPMDGGGERKPTAFLHTPFNEFQGQLSPDSSWMAYTSEVSGQREVYVRTFPAGERELRISVAGGEQPRWRGDGKELFYIAGDGKINAVSVKASIGPRPSLDTGAPVALFDPHGILVTNYFNYDVTADGQRFLASANPTTEATGASEPPLIVMANWNANSKK